MFWFLNYANMEPAILDSLEKHQGRNVRRPDCSFDLNTAFSLLVSLDEHRGFTFNQGMKKPVYKRIPTRLLKDEMDFYDVDIDKEYLKAVFDTMDRMYVKHKNSQAG